MQLAELSARSGVSIPSIKYYRREGLLSAGPREGRGRAEYDTAHLERLRLVRALVEAGGLPLSRVRSVLETIDMQPDSIQDVLASAFDCAESASGADTTRASRLVGRLDWSISDAPGRLEALSSALAGLDSAGLDLSEDYLVEIGRAVQPLARLEVDGIPTDTPSGVLRYLVLGTVLVGPVILALRELAYQDIAARRLDS